MRLRPDMTPAALTRRPLFKRHVKLLVLILAALAVASVMSNRGLVRLVQLHRERAELAREIEYLQATNAGLAAEAHGLKTDPGRIEAIAREELGLVKPDEIIYEFRTPAPGP